MQATELAETRDDMSTHHWPQAHGGAKGRYGSTDFVAPINLTRVHAWSWQDPRGKYRNMLFGGPVIDSASNLYVAARDGIRKFSPDGLLLWHKRAPAPLSRCPSLWKELLFGQTDEGHVFALRLDGTLAWLVQPAKSAGSDCAYVQAHAGVVVVGLTSPGQIGGSAQLLGLNALSGATLWAWDPRAVLGPQGMVYNVFAMFTRRSCVFMDPAGGVHRLALSTGRQAWYAPPPLAFRHSFSDGGTTLSPDGKVVFSCSNVRFGGGLGPDKCDSNCDPTGGGGVVRAYRVRDGQLLWNRTLPHACNTWPAATRDSVVVPTGAFTSIPTTLSVRNKRKQRRLHAQSLSRGQGERRALGHPELPASILSLDATNGTTQWQLPVTPFGRESALGDEEGVMERLVHDPRRPICLPAQWGGPIIAGDGAVYVPRADGLLYVVRPPSFSNGGSASSGSAPTLATFPVGGASLHPGVAWAPGLMAMATCEELHVWRSPEIARISAIGTE